MSKNYDNWERLVRAVLRGEHDRQTALNHSRDPSSISSASSTFSRSFSSSSQFDHDQSLVHAKSHNLSVGNPDLTIDHTDWKTLLPPDKQEVIWRSASLSFFLDERTGKNCFMIGAKKLVIPERYCQIKCHPKSRFSEVAEVTGSGQFTIGGSIKTRMLSPETFYAAYIVFGLTETNVDLGSAYSIISYHSKTSFDPPYDKLTDDYSQEHARIVHFQPGDGRNGQIAVSRSDGWMEVDMGYFYVSQRRNGEIEAWLLEYGGHKKSALIVVGIEFRPSETPVVSKGKRYTRGKGVFSKFRISG